MFCKPLLRRCNNEGAEGFKLRNSKIIRVLFELPPCPVIQVEGNTVGKLLHILRSPVNFQKKQRGIAIFF